MSLAPAFALPGSGGEPAPPSATLFTWPRTIVYGLLAGSAAAAMDMLTVPLGQMDSVERVFLLSDVMFQYCPTGVAIACIAKLAAGRLSAWQLALAVVLVAAVGAAAHANIGVLSFYDKFAFARRSWSSFLYDFWHSVYYGGVFMFACVYSLRIEQTRRLLGQAEIARGRTEAVLGQARLEALRGQVDPGFLVRVMAEVQHRYASQPGAADALLDQLVAFLREAMPAVRGGKSSLAAELCLAQTYLALRAELDPAHAGCHIVVQPGLFDAPFPPLLVLPLLDQLVAATPAQSPCGLKVATLADREDCIARVFSGPLHGAGTWLDPKLAYRLRVGLQSIYGAHA